MNNGDEVLGDEALIKHVTRFYKVLFGQATVTNPRIEALRALNVISYLKRTKWN
jgi:hypothetical protein